MHDSGQATVDYLGIVAVLAALALALGAALVATGVDRRLFAALRQLLGGAPETASLDPRLRALAEAAVEGGPGAPTMRDARLVLAAAVGENAARAELTSLAASRYGPRLLGLAGDEQEKPRPGRRWVYVVPEWFAGQLAAVQRWQRRDAASAEAALIAAGVGAAIEFGPLAPFAASAAISLLDDDPGRALRAGAREGDVLLCQPVRWRARGSARVPAAGSHGAITRRSPRPGDRIDGGRFPGLATDATLRVFFRAGRPIAREVLLGDAC